MFHDFSLHDVVQFNEKHKWAGCLGIIDEVKDCGSDFRYMVGVPVPQQGTAYIFVMESDDSIEKIGVAHLIEGGSEDDA